MLSDQGKYEVEMHQETVAVRKKVLPYMLHGLCH